MIRTSLLLWLFILSPASQAIGIDCSNLSDDSRIKNFAIKTRSSNPLGKKNLSALVSLTPCKAELCLQKNHSKRGQKRETVHILKMNDQKRVYYLKGPHTQQCFIIKGKREFRCTACDLTSNGNCRSFKTSGEETRIRGTNIDSTDFDLIEDKNHRSTCDDLSDKYVKITTLRIAGDSAYNKIITIYEKQREVPVIINYYAKNRLRKVYRFYPRYYTRIDDHWFATVLRVRTTFGSEKKYTFETIVKIIKGADGGLYLYPDPEKDPLISADNRTRIFNISK